MSTVALEEGVLIAVAAVKLKTCGIDLHVPFGRVRGAGTGLEPACGTCSAADPRYMASSRGDVQGLLRWHTQRAVRTLPKLPLRLRPETRPTS